MENKKLNEAYYQPENFCTGGKTIKELQKIRCMPENDVKSWLAKHALWQAHIPPSREINHPHYEVTKPNE